MRLALGRLGRVARRVVRRSGALRAGYGRGGRRGEGRFHFRIVPGRGIRPADVAIASSRWPRSVGKDVRCATFSGSPGADLTRIDTRATPGIKGGQGGGRERRGDQRRSRLATLQGQLYAEGPHGRRRSVLLVLQGMDTSGKGGTIKRSRRFGGSLRGEAFGFGRPTAVELKHDFLWRIRRALPGAGRDRRSSTARYYEDVVAARVRGNGRAANLDPALRVDQTASRSSWPRSGTMVIKCFLHISTRSTGRAAGAAPRAAGRPRKALEVQSGDLDDRELWDDYMAAYEDALDRCSTRVAPWHVMPADRKWYRDWALAALVAERLDELDLSWPKDTFALPRHAQGPAAKILMADERPATTSGAIFNPRSRWHHGDRGRPAGRAVVRRSGAAATPGGRRRPSSWSSSRSSCSAGGLHALPPRERCAGGPGPRAARGPGHGDHEHRPDIALTRPAALKRRSRRSTRTCPAGGYIENFRLAPTGSTRSSWTDRGCGAPWRSTRRFDAHFLGRREARIGEGFDPGDIPVACRSGASSTRRGTPLRARARDLDYMVVSRSARPQWVAFWKQPLKGNQLIAQARRRASCRRAGEPAR